MPKRTSSRTPAKVTEKSSALQREVINLSLAAVGILLLLAMVGILGPFGTVLRNILFGFFGIGAFFMPVALLVYAVLKLLSRDLVLPVVKIIALNWLILSLLHIFIFTR
jgi:S-DNA-T family DNA segregation ATPase FtsK/SpoIIIE